jgi:MFS family permease
MTNQPKVLSRSQLAAVVAGNALEFYDFLIFGIFAIPIGAAFFPAHDETGRLLLSFATFGVGFVPRPLGGFVIGLLGDRIGRKPTMMLSFSLMGLSIVGMALTPSYAAIGVAAPVLVVLFRLVQGFALGGEVGPTTAFLMEAAPEQNRGLYIALQTGTQQAATACAGIVGLLLATLLVPAELSGWSWRIAMLLGASVAPLALAIRRQLPETLEQRQDRIHLPRPTLVQIGQGFLSLLTLASATITTYVLISINTFATHTLGLTPAQGYGAAAIGGATGAVFNLVGGRLSDRIGRKPVMIGAYSLLCLAGLPCFMAMAQLRTPLALYAAVTLMAALLAIGLPPILAQVSESLPPQMRSGAIGIIYAIAVSLFGGTAPFVVTWLTAISGSPLAPAWYMCGALALGVLCMFTLHETAPVKASR